MQGPVVLPPQPVAAADPFSDLATPPPAAAAATGTSLESDLPLSANERRQVWMGILHRGLHFGAVVAVVVGLVFMQSRLGSRSQVHSGLAKGQAAYLRETGLSEMETLLARGTCYSHLLLPDGRLSIHPFDQKVHAADLQRINRLFPVAGERQQVLAWGAALVESCKLRGFVPWHEHQRTEKLAPATGMQQPSDLDRLMQLQPNEALSAHAAWRRLSCAAGANESDLFDLQNVVRRAVPDAAQLRALLAWAGQRRRQRYLERHFTFEGKTRVCVSRPRVPSLVWFDSWILYEDWCVTGPMFEARKRDLLQRFAGDPADGKRLQALLGLGREWARQRAGSPNGSLPSDDERARVVAVVDRFSGIDPTFSPRLADAARKHVEFRDYLGVDVDPLAGLLRRLEANSPLPYRVEQGEPGDPRPARAGMKLSEAGSATQFCCFPFYMPFVWILMRAVTFLTLDLPGIMLGMTADARFRELVSNQEGNPLWHIAVKSTMGVLGSLAAGWLCPPDNFQALVSPSVQNTFMQYLAIILISGSIIDGMVNFAAVLGFRLGKGRKLGLWFSLAGAGVCFLGVLLVRKEPFTVALIIVGVALVRLDFLEWLVNPHGRRAACSSKFRSTYYFRFGFMAIGTTWLVFSVFLVLIHISGSQPQPPQPLELVPAKQQPQPGEQTQMPQGSAVQPPKQGDQQQTGQPNNKEQAADLQRGTLVLRTAHPLLAGVKAFVEVDGHRVMDWPNNKLEVTVTVAAGRHRVVVRSKLGASYYKKEFSASVPAGGVVKLSLGAVDRDLGANW